MLGLIINKAAQPRSLEKNAASRAGQTPCARWAVGLFYANSLKPEALGDRAFEEKQQLDVNGKYPGAWCVNKAHQTDTPGRGVGCRLGGGLYEAYGGLGFVSLI